MSTVSVNIQRYSVSFGYNGHVEYYLKVLYHGRQWFIRKRYSEFDYFDKKIRKFFPLLRKLPPKTYWGIYNEEIIKERIIGLDLYLLTLIKLVPTDNNLLKEFLEVDLNMLIYNLKSNDKYIINKIDYYQNILLRFTRKIIHINVDWRLKNCGEILPSQKRVIKSYKKRNKSNQIDFRKLSLVSSSNIDLDENESLRDSIRQSYISQSDDIWTTRISEELLEQQPSTPINSNQKSISNHQIIQLLSSKISNHSNHLFDTVIQQIKQQENNLIFDTNFVICTSFSTPDIDITLPSCSSSLTSNPMLLSISPNLFQTTTTTTTTNDHNHNNNTNNNTQLSPKREPHHRKYASNVSNSYQSDDDGNMILRIRHTRADSGIDMISSNK